MSEEVKGILDMSPDSDQSRDETMARPKTLAEWELIRSMQYTIHRALYGVVYLGLMAVSVCGRI